MKQYGKRDKNQIAIIKDLRASGFSVVDLASVGGGCPDILVGARGRNYLFEIKCDSKAKMRPMQIDFFTLWHGQMHRINNSEEAINIIGGK